MDMTVLSGAAAIALTSAVVFLIVVHGWEIDEQRGKEYLAVNERNIAMLTGWKDQADYLMNEHVEAIQKMLNQRCTRFRMP